MSGMLISDLLNTEHLLLPAASAASNHLNALYSATHLGQLRHVPALQQNTDVKMCFAYDCVCSYDIEAHARRGVI